MKIDLEIVKEQSDLLAICERDTALKKVAKIDGGEWAGACPVCGGKDRFRVQPVKKRWLCRNCTQGKWRDVIAYIALRDGLNPQVYKDLKEICEKALPGDTPYTSAPIKKTLPPQPAYQPSEETWQAAAHQVIDICAAKLWQPEGQRALDYLRQRGLRDETIKAFSLGFSPGGDISGLYVKHGITIPCTVNGEVWYVKIRLPSTKPEEEKYICVPGSKTAAIYNADKLRGCDAALFVEGEFDVLIAHQTFYDLVPCVSLGSATNTPDLASWGAYLLPLKTILSCYDADKAGEAGAEMLSNLAGERVKLAPLPSGNWKDINDFYKAGGDLRSWVMSYLNFYCPLPGDSMVDLLAAEVTK